MIDISKYEGHTPAPWELIEREGTGLFNLVMWRREEEKAVAYAYNSGKYTYEYPNARLMADAPLLLEEVKRLREDYENMSEVLRENGMDICRHCRVIYRDDDMNHPHYPSLHPWHMDGMCMKELIE